MGTDAISNKYLTAEHAENAEGKKYNAFVLSGAASLLFVFLCVLCELCGELLVPFSIRPAAFLPAAGLNLEP